MARLPAVAQMIYDVWNSVTHFLKVSLVNSSGTEIDFTDLAQESGGNLDTIAGDTTSIDGKITACDTSGLSLESGGNLDTIAGDTTSIDGKTPSLGTAAMAASSPVTIATDDTVSVAIGTTADVAVDSDTTGTVIGFLRGLVKIAADVWDSSFHLIKIQNQSPEHVHYIDVDPAVDVTNVAVNTYFKKILAEGYRNFVFQLIGSSGATGITFKIYETLDESATEPSAGGTPGSTWTDVSSDILGAASFVINTTSGDRAGYFRVDTNDMPEAFLVEYDVDNATNTVDVLFRKF